MSQPVPPEDRTPKCAQCHKKPVSAQYRPFCSKRCADVDLNRWLSGAYAIPAAGEDDGEDAGENDYPGGFEG